jgi:hypothetical protein
MYFYLTLNRMYGKCKTSNGMNSYSDIIINFKLYSFRGWWPCLLTAGSAQPRSSQTNG